MNRAHRHRQYKTMHQNAGANKTGTRTLETYPGRPKEGKTVILKIRLTRRKTMMIRIQEAYLA